MIKGFGVGAGENLNKRTLDNRPFLELKALKKYFEVKRGISFRRKTYLRAVDGVTFSIMRGETFGLVGESGCGKTTIGRIILRLYDPTDGDVLLDQRSIIRVKSKELGDYRNSIQAVFQNPYASLNQRMKIWRIIGEPLTPSKLSEAKIKARVTELLDLVGLSEEYFYRFPHELSAGQRQQVAIARALSVNPKFIVLDEPTSLLDVSAQASIVNLIVNLQEKLEITYLFISHNLAVVEYLSDRIGVMYCGKLVELGSSKEIYENPLHPYIRALIASTPIPDPDSKGEEIILEGEVMSPIDPPPGCRFCSRCKDRVEECNCTEPLLKPLENGHMVACHRYKETEQSSVQGAIG